MANDCTPHHAEPERPNRCASRESGARRADSHAIAYRSEFVFQRFYRRPANERAIIRRAISRTWHKTNDDLNTSLNVDQQAVVASKMKDLEKKTKGMQSWLKSEMPPVLILRSCGNI